MSASTFIELRRLRETVLTDPVNRKYTSNTASNRIERLKMRTIKETLDKYMDNLDERDDFCDDFKEKSFFFDIPSCPFLTVSKIIHKTTSCMSMSDISVWYHKLADIIKSINVLYEEYNKGNFESIAHVFTLGVYQELSVQLVNIRNLRCDFKDYETLRRSTTYALGGLYQSMLQYSRINNLTNMFNNCKERNSILTDPVKLKEYIDSLNRKTTIFPESTVRVTAAKIKPEYVEYIKLYGYPPGGVFDMDKLGIIIKRLQNPSDSESVSESDSESDSHDSGCGDSVSHCDDSNDDSSCHDMPHSILPECEACS
jgi:hypothetical protein